MKAYIFWIFTCITVNIQVFRQKSPQGRPPSLAKSRRYTYCLHGTDVGRVNRNFWRHGYGTCRNEVRQLLFEKSVLFTWIAWDRERFLLFWRVDNVYKVL